MIDTLQPSDWISLAALALAVYSVVHTVRSTRQQSELNAHEIRLIKHQLAEVEKEAEVASTARVSARMYKHSKNEWRIKVYNAGPGSAFDVEVVPSKNDGSFISKGDLDAKFPYGKLEKGQSVELYAHVYMGSQAKEVIQLKWRDEAEKSHTNAVEVSI